MTRAAVVAAVVALAGCYDPTYRDLACGANGACPSGYTCEANVCVRDVPVDSAVDVAEGDGPIDAVDAPPIDAMTDATIDAVPPCLAGDRTSPTDPTRCFRFRPTAQPWTAARDFCLTIGGRLADVRNAQENVALLDIIGSSQATWLGGTDVALEGTWVWSDGSLFTFNAWAEGQPNGGTTTNCLRFVGPGVLTFGPSDWTDLACAEAHPFICVVPPG